MLIALAGLPASGKSTLGRRLAPMLEALLLDKDVLRAVLFADQVDYSAAQNDLVVDIAYRAAAYVHDVRDEPVVIIDGRTFSESHQIDSLVRAAGGMNTPLAIIECRCSSRSAQRRLSEDDGAHPAADRNFDLYLRRRAGAQPIEEPTLVLDTDLLDIEQCLKLSTAYVADVQRVWNVS